MKPPCVVVVKYLLPAIRLLVTKELVEKYNLRKIDASERMELTPAAITQYFKGERGTIIVQEIAQSRGAMELVSELAELLAKAEEVPADRIIEKVCKICSSIRYEKVICKLHQKDMPSLEECRCPSCQP
ncbi:MAG: hypothetical protein RMK50_04515 [Nitrososphaerota archaeon]|nr:hypothetical protein [Candidatus Bathyarchaeota archaeon]MDW8194064.1 hypothetical protein [Nitrososphaerota archaeon]